MDEKEIKQAEELYEIGENIGFMFGALIRGILDGVEAFEMSVAARDIEEIHETECGLKRRRSKRKSAIAAGAGAINARSSKSAYIFAKASFRTGYARSLASGAKTECALCLARRSGAPTSFKAKGLIMDRTKRGSVRSDDPDASCLSRRRDKSYST
jgi:hypothetical protein